MAVEVRSREIARALVDALDSVNPLLALGAVRVVRARNGRATDASHNMAEIRLVLQRAT